VLTELGVLRMLQFCSGSAMLMVSSSRSRKQVIRKLHLYFSKIVLLF